MSPPWPFSCRGAALPPLRVLLEAYGEHPAQASPPHRAVAPGQGADGRPPTETPGSPRWPPLGRSRAPATGCSRAAAPCSGVQRAVRAISTPIMAAPWPPAASPNGVLETCGLEQILEALKLLLSPGGEKTNLGAWLD